MNTHETPGAVGPAVTFGPPAAWAVHDLEELPAVPGWSRDRLPELQRRFPQVPERVWSRPAPADGREFAAAVAGMAPVVTAAAAAGHRTGGRSAFHHGR
ncbi:HXXEE domain-containing protein [Streptomyces sp. NPDC086023]|uniref:HXXEE domain-containing protein n=1 Tax=Streptomyces sp. NPDC086023 TaxID=3365746 RepID=UPI0037CE65E5